MARYYAVFQPTFQPQMLSILSITPGVSATTIVTTYDGLVPGIHNYQTGLIVRLNIPYGWGFQQGDQFSSEITVLSPTSFSMPLNSSGFDPFVVPPEQPGNLLTAPTVVPVGEINSLLTESTQNVLPYPLHMIP